MAELFFDCLRDETAARLDRGLRLADVQAELIDEARGLTEDERAALWLFAWAYRPGGRREAGHALEGAEG